MKKHFLKTFLCVGWMMMCVLQNAIGQVNVPIVPVGKGSYGNGTPFDLVKNTWGSNNNWAVWDQLMAIHGKWPAKWKIGVADTNTRSIPTNDEWTKMLFQENGNWGGMIWNSPTNIQLKTTGSQVWFPNSWNNNGSSLDAGYGIEIEPAGNNTMTANKCTVKNWSDWLTQAEITDGTNKMEVAFGHGFPYVWFTPNFNPTIHIWDAPFTTDGVTPITTWPFVGDHFVGMASGKMFAIFMPPNTTVTKAAGNNFKLTFSGADKYFVVGLLNKASDLNELYKYAYVKPVSTEVKWNYNQSNASIGVTWNVKAVNLKGEAGTDVLQGFIPHHYQRSLSTPSFNAMTYLTPKGTMKCSVGKSFDFSYRFSGILPNVPVPKYNKADKYPFDSTYLASTITEATPKTALGSDIYWGLKPLLNQSKYAAIAAATKHPNAGALKEKVRAAFKDWLTYTPGETSRCFYRYDEASNLDALVGFDPGGYSATFTDHDMCYGYMLYAAATYAMVDSTFLNDFGPMLKLITKHINNWDRSDNTAPFLRLMDPWNGHSWAGGTSGADVESVSECMQFASGMFLLGEMMGDKGMRDAGAFIYSTMSRAYDQYIRDVDAINFSPNFSLGVAAKLNNSGPALGNYVGGEALYWINWIPYAPGMNFLFSDTTVARAKYDKFMVEYGANINKWGDDFYNNLTQYIQGFDRGKALQMWHDYNANYQDHDLKGITYYYIYSANTLGSIDWSRWTSSPTSQVYYNSSTKLYTYVAYNPTGVEQTITAYNQGVVIGTFKVPPYTTVATHLDAVLTSIKISGDGDVVKPTSTMQLSTTGLDQYGASAAITNPVVWTVIYGTGTISNTGLYTAANTNADSVIVQAASGNLKATYKLRVNDLRRPVKLILSPDYQKIVQGSVIYYDAKVYDQYGGLLSSSDVEWKTTGGGTMTDEGVFVSDNTLGTFTITATLGALSYQAIAVVYAPLDLTDNIALNRPSYTDNSVGGNTAPKANDGNTTSRWETQQKAQDGNAQHWWYVKLDTVYNMSQVVIVWDGAAAATYAIQASLDGVKWTTVDSTSLGVWGATETFDLFTKNVTTKYLRVWCYVRATDYGYSIKEFRAYGTKAVTPKPLSKIVINPGEFEVKIGQTITYTAKGFNNDGNSVASPGTWSVNGGGSINQTGVFTAQTVGTYKVKYISGSIIGEAIVNVVDDYLTSIEKGMVNPVTFSFYPNPANDYITIKYAADTESDLYLFDVSGKIVIQEKLQSGTTNISIDNLSSGFYFLHVKNNSTSFTNKLIKQ